MNHSCFIVLFIVSVKELNDEFDEISGGFFGGGGGGYQFTFAVSDKTIIDGVV